MPKPKKLTTPQTTPESRRACQAMIRAVANPGDKEAFDEFVRETNAAIDAAILAKVSDANDHARDPKTLQTAPEFVRI